MAAPVAVISVLLPSQIEGETAVKSMVSAGAMVMLTVALPVQPFASVPVTVYVIDVEGFAVTELPVVAERLVLGAQV